MKLGWVDFSTEDRNKVFSVMNLLQEQGALDELGIGLIRDAFANRFFPGTSTIQTRAKYFLIVPYVLKEAIDGKYGNNPTVIMRKINDEERACALQLYNKCQDEGSSPIGKGIIGARNLPYKWVTRTPSEIYWSGIRTWKICEQGTLSIQRMIEYSISMRNQEKVLNLGNRSDDKEEGQKDDIDAGRDQRIRLLDLPEYPENWRDELDITLKGSESEFLYRKITESVPNSLLAFILQNGVNIEEYQNFEALYEDQKDEVPEEMAHLMKLACDFNRLVYAARVRYNILLSRGMNDFANNEWNYIEGQITRFADVDLEDVYQTLNILNIRLRRFLTNLQMAFLSNDWNLADELIRKQEIDLKTRSRAKLCHTEDYDPSVWIGGGYLDYRFFSARRIISDIYGAEGEYSV